jgi:hypothetical protein
VNEFAGAEFTCDPNTTATCIDGDEHLERLKFDDVKIWENCLILFGMIVGFNALALAIIYYRQPKYLALGARDTASDKGVAVEAKKANDGRAGDGLAKR